MNTTERDGIFGNKAKKPVEVKMHRRAKTARKYERVDNVLDFLRVIEKHGDKVAFTYFDKKRNFFSSRSGDIDKKVCKTNSSVWRNSVKCFTAIAYVANPTTIKKLV